MNNAAKDISTVNWTVIRSPLKWNRRLLLETLMRSRAIVILNIFR
jgi:hypothetical protein